MSEKKFKDLPNQVLMKCFSWAKYQGVEIDLEAGLCSNMHSGGFYWNFNLEKHKENLFGINDRTEYTGLWHDVLVNENYDSLEKIPSLNKILSVKSINLNQGGYNLQITTVEDDFFILPAKEGDSNRQLSAFPEQFRTIFLNENNIIHSRKLGLVKNGYNSDFKIDADSTITSCFAFSDSKLSSMFYDAASMRVSFNHADKLKNHLKEMPVFKVAGSGYYMKLIEQRADIKRIIEFVKK